MKTLINQVLEQNHLSDEVRLFIESGGISWHVDRHVDVTTKAHKIAIKTACAAGMQLLRQWHYEMAAILEAGLFVSKPVLVIDDEWLQGLPEAPLPHVLITISKDCSVTKANDFERGGEDGLQHFPLKALMEEQIGQAKVIRVDRNPTPPFDNVGFWLVMLE